MKTHPTALLALLAAFSAFAVAPLSAAVTDETDALNAELDAQAARNAVIWAKIDVQKAARGDFAPYGFRIEKVARGDHAEIVRGITQMAVLRLMSSPQRKLSPDVWIYQNHPIGGDATAARGCDTLVLTFAADGTLSGMKIVNARAIAVIAASLKQPSGAIQLAQK